MTIPATSAQITTFQVLPRENTQDGSAGPENITAVPDTKKIIPRSNQSVLFYNDSITDKKISVIGEKAIMEDYQSDIQLPKQLLGEGVFGQVSKGLLQYKNGLQREVAIKTIYSECYDKENFYNEVKALQTLVNQDHIVQFYFALHGISGFNYHIIMECGDIDLEEYINFIKKHPEININNKQLAKVGHDVFSGMLACLEFNIFNIDIKPKNLVVFFSQGKIKIIDFGFLSPKKHLDDNILNTMITRTTNSFIQCTLNKADSNHQETQNKLEIISLHSANDFPVSDKEKAYFKQHIPTYVNDNPLLLKLTQGVFSGESNLSDITKTIADLKNKVGLQALTDVRHLL